MAAGKPLGANPNPSPLASRPFRPWRKPFNYKPPALMSDSDRQDNQCLDSPLLGGSACPFVQGRDRSVQLRGAWPQQPDGAKFLKEVLLPEES